MSSVYDWVTVAIFSAIVLLFLQRSVGEADPSDHMIAYLPPAAGCAIANQLGNHGADIWAIALIGATLAYVAMVLRPFRRGG